MRFDFFSNVCVALLRRKGLDIVNSSQYVCLHGRIQRGNVVWTHMKNQVALFFLRNTGTDLPQELIGPQLLLRQGRYSSL